MTATILVVDDSIEVQDSLRALLSQNGYEVDLASDGQQAVDHLRHAAVVPDLVLLDLDMPVMDGWEFLWWHAHDPASHRVPIVLLSDEVHQRAEVPTRHVAFVVPKPVNPVHLLDTVHALLAGH